MTKKLKKTKCRNDPSNAMHTAIDIPVLDLKDIIVQYDGTLGDDRCTYKLTHLQEGDTHKFSIQPVNTQLDMSWTDKGLGNKTELKADGNGDVELKCDGRKFKLDICELERLGILIKAFNATEPYKQRIFEVNINEILN